MITFTPLRNETELKLVLERAVNEKWRDLALIDEGKDDYDFVYLDRLKLTHIYKLTDGFTLDVMPHEILSMISLRKLSILSGLRSLFPKGSEHHISKLRSLASLQVCHNRLTTIPEYIELLPNLEFLDFRKNRLKKLPLSIGNLKKLRALYLGNNQLNELPQTLEGVKDLHHLDLSANKFTYVPEVVLGLSELRGLDLYTNSIKDLPKAIRNLKKLAWMDININPVSSDIPPEILDLIQEPKKIIDYYFATRGSTTSIGELKLLVLGQGSVGKTSIINRILSKRFRPKEKKTDGIDINHLTLEELDRNTHQKTIRLNIWDFGGQEIMHATHQFFLTKRSLYLLVLDSRLTQEENRVEYWLKIIQSFGEKSPVLIVGNKVDQHPLDIDRAGLEQKYPNIARIIETSAATGFGIKELRVAITEQVKNLPHVHDLLPETWSIIKTRLESLGHETDFITYDRYLEICAENEINDEMSQDTLIRFLHDLGVVLHFQDNLRLEALGILNPQWVTNGVYKILNSHALFQNKGVLTVSMLDEILNLPEYPRGKRLFIVDMMKKFELCYDIETDTTFLVPDLLPKDQPEMNFNGIPAFEYAYPVLPSSVITRFIVRMNQHIHEGFVWRTGVLLKIGENPALVKADIEDRKITIAIGGLEHTRRDALSAIRYQLDEIHESIKGLNPEKYVPVPGASDAEPLEYETLLMMEREGIETTHVKSGRKLIAVNVSQMLNGVEREYQRKQYGTVINIGGDVHGGTIIVGNDNEVNK